MKQKYKSHFRFSLLCYNRTIPNIQKEGISMDFITSTPFINAVVIFAFILLHMSGKMPAAKSFATTGVICLVLMALALGGYFVLDSGLCLSLGLILSGLLLFVNQNPPTGKENSWLFRDNHLKILSVILIIIGVGAKF